MYQVNFENDKVLHVSRNNSKYRLNNEEMDLDILKLQPGKYQIFYHNKAHQIEVLEYDKVAKSMRLKINGKVSEITLKTDLDLLLEKLGMDNTSSSKMNELKAPMPGLIHKINIVEGQEVKKGDALLILEAMKMENVIKAQGDGIVKAIHVKEKQSVEKNEVLMEF
jgi:biotin carboxyl carrier protein